MKIQELQLLTDHLEETKKFYHHRLGLPILENNEQKLVLVAGETLLIFQPSNAKKPRYHFAFTIPCNKIKEAFSWFPMPDRIVPIQPQQPIADFKNWNAAAFYFMDNNENIVEFIARDDLNNASEQYFSGNSIISISEIGIVCNDVSEECADLINKYGISYFSKQPAFPHFAALGDDEGLLIVVSENRLWYPTEIPSSKHWLRVHFQVNGHDQVLELHHQC